MQQLSTQTAFARTSDPETSKLAAATLKPSKLESIVLDIIRSFPDGATQDDVVDALPNIRHSSVTPRFRPLLRKGLIIDTGLRRKGSSNHPQRVMMAVH